PHYSSSLPRRPQPIRPRAGGRVRLRDGGPARQAAARCRGHGRERNYAAAGAGPGHQHGRGAPRGGGQRARRPRLFGPPAGGHRVAQYAGGRGAAGPEPAAAAAVAAAEAVARGGGAGYALGARGGPIAAAADGVSGLSRVGRGAGPHQAGHAAVDCRQRGKRAAVLRPHFRALWCPRPGPDGRGLGYASFAHRHGRADGAVCAAGRAIALEAAH
nr:hypothetical protein [Tanacetum cinerariifolium]